MTLAKIITFTCQISQLQGLFGTGSLFHTSKGQESSSPGTKIDIWCPFWVLTDRAVAPICWPNISISQYVSKLHWQPTINFYAASMYAAIILRCFQVFMLGIFESKFFLTITSYRTYMYWTMDMYAFILTLEYKLLRTKCT